MDKDEIIAELRRVAELLQTTYFTRSEFKEYGRINPSTVERKFGTWNQALEAAGLETVPSLANQRAPDEVYLQEIIRLTREVGRQPTIYELTAKGRFSEKPYRERWGGWVAACKAAYAEYGFPLDGEVTFHEDLPERVQSISRPVRRSVRPTIPETHKLEQAFPRKKVQYGEPMDFRGLRHAPINEQGVVYLFGMVSRELGFLIESVKAPYPDCEGKRCVDEKRQLWERVLIEFEFQSSNFRLHKHDPQGCDLIVCWIHDWEGCPIEVIALRSVIKQLPK